MDKTELITPRTAPISCPFESAVEGTAKKCRNNSYVPSIKCTSISSPVSSRKAMLQDRANDLGDQCHVMAHSKSTLQLAQTISLAPPCSRANCGDPARQLRG